MPLGKMCDLGHSHMTYVRYYQTENSRPLPTTVYQICVFHLFPLCLRCTNWQPSIGSKKCYLFLRLRSNNW